MTRGVHVSFSQNQELAVNYPPLPEAFEMLEEEEGDHSDDDPDASVATAHSHSEEEEQPPPAGASPLMRKRSRGEDAPADATSKYVHAADGPPTAVDPSVVHDVIPLAYKPPMPPPPPKRPCVDPTWDLDSGSDDE